MRPHATTLLRGALCLPSQACRGRPEKLGRKITTGSLCYLGYEIAFADKPEFVMETQGFPSTASASQQGSLFSSNVSEGSAADAAYGGRETVRVGDHSGALAGLDGSCTGAWAPEVPLGQRLHFFGDGSSSGAGGGGSPFREAFLAASLGEARTCAGNEDAAGAAANAEAADRLESGAAPDLADGSSQNVLHAACFPIVSSTRLLEGQLGILRTLLGGFLTADDRALMAAGPGRLINVEGESLSGSPLARAVGHGNIDLLEMLVRQGGAAVTDSDYLRLKGNRRSRKEVTRLLPMVSQLECRRAAQEPWHEPQLKGSQGAAMAAVPMAACAGLVSFHSLVVSCLLAQHRGVAADGVPAATQ